jgi:hypothetical protein
MNRAEGWKARFRFSFVEPDVQLWDIVPVRNAPSRSRLSVIAAWLVANLRVCRDAWWRVQGDVCLANRMIDGRRVVRARYDLSTGSTHLEFRAP